MVAPIFARYVLRVIASRFVCPHTSKMRLVVCPAGLRSPLLSVLKSIQPKRPNVGKCEVNDKDLHHARISNDIVLTQSPERFTPVLP